jgi:hypothetical protein
MNKYDKMAVFLVQKKCVNHVRNEKMRNFNYI